MRTSMRGTAVGAAVAGLVLTVLVGCGEEESRPREEARATGTPSATSEPEPETNGVESLPPRKAVAKAVRTMRANETFTYEGTTLYPLNGRNHKVPTTWTISEDGSCEIVAHGGIVGRFALRAIGDKMYTSASDKGWRVVFGADDDAVRRFRGLWVRNPRPDGVVAGCELDQLLPVQGSQGTFKGRRIVDVDGVPARRLDGRHLDKTWTVFVAIEGEPRILRVLGHDATGPMRMDLVRAGDGPMVAVPPKKKTVDPDGLSST